MNLIAIDPGTTHSAYCWLVAGKVGASDFLPNAEVLDRLRSVSAPPAPELAIEMIASYGMPVGREVFETCVWIGRFVQAWSNPDSVRLVYRKDVKIWLCGSAKAKDANVRQALIDLYGPVGTKKDKGPLYGVSGHIWSALAVASCVEKKARPAGVLAGVAEAI